MPTFSNFTNIVQGQIFWNWTAVTREKMRRYPAAVTHTPGRRKSSIGTMILGLHASYDFGMEVVLCEGCFDEN